MIFIHRVNRAAISQSSKKKRKKEKKNWRSRVSVWRRGCTVGRSRARRPGVPIPACHNRGMSSPLGWPAHGCATELFIPLDYTRCAVRRRAAPSGRRKRPRFELARERSVCWPCYRARIALSGIDARNPAYFALLRDIERPITRTTYVRTSKK